MAEMTVPDLMNVLHRTAGADESVDLTSEAVAHTDFEELGYESLALLEAAGAIEREHGVSLDETAFADARTPQALVDLVNEVLSNKNS